MDAGRRHRPSSPVDAEEMDATTVPRRQINLGRKDVLERRTERADVREQWPIGFFRLRLRALIEQSGGASDGGGRF
jgi:hypothetical protein